jgi:hypothetical protein
MKSVLTIMRARAIPQKMKGFAVTFTLIDRRPSPDTSHRGEPLALLRDARLRYGNLEEQYLQLTNCHDLDFQRTRCYATFAPAAR